MSRYKVGADHPQQGEGVKFTDGIVTRGGGGKVNEGGTGYEKGERGSGGGG